MRRLTCLFIAVWLGALAFGCGGEQRHRSQKRLVVLGVDGMDPQLARQYMAQGRMPNLKKLADAGQFLELGTSNPPQSPVAWSNVITGAESDVHGIYDFVHRDPDELGPYLSTSRTEAAEDGLFGLLSAPEMKLLRKGVAFWEVLDEAGVPATVVKMPAHFPPAPAGTNEVLAGMGTPDVMGTYGTFQLLTDDPAFAGKRISGGIVHALDFAGGHKARAALEGPPDPEGGAMTVTAEVIRDPKRKVAVVRLGDADLVLEPGEWSEWTQVSFDAGLIAGSLSSIARVYLKSLEPHVNVYVSPLNLDPTDPLMPVSSPESYASELARDTGLFYTQGMPEETKGLNGGVLTDDEFLAQGELIFDESVRQLDRELDRLDQYGGLLFFYFSSIDLTSHMFYRAIKDSANEHDRQYAHVIPDLYARIDVVIGQVLERAGPDTPVLVMSDHGFAPYNRHVHLNTWLANRGYLALQQGERGEGALGHIDWDNTQAYNLGLNQVFVNLQGREAHGAVPPEDKELVLDRLSRDLEAMRDPDTGASVVSRVFRPADGAFPERQPDLIVGFARGYRMSDESATGVVGDAAVTDNHSKWSGDHCMDPRLVPGVLFSTVPLTDEPVDLTDIAPSILRYFGVEPPAQMKGQSVFQADSGAGK